MSDKREGKKKRLDGERKGVKRDAFKRDLRGKGESKDRENGNVG